MSARRRRTVRGTSKHAQSFRFDLAPEHWMRAGTGHHVGLPAKDIAHLFLDIDELDQTEAGVVGIKKKSTSLSGRDC
jgi:hypothetical protein